ncbi:hypothetical protein [Polaromonas hydrogenivorans]|uniref:Uncharacterized protein n=1 Tax=Polaromonas hydrogenivorans TaxID=335476 RepID=A0AAU7M0U7_9BURK
MLLRQALEHIRAGMPAPVQFNSRMVVLDQMDEVSAMMQKDVLDSHFHTVHNGATIRSFLRGSGQVRQDQPYRKAATVVTGAQAS